MGYYKLSNANDSSGMGHNLTDTGVAAVTFSQGKFDNAGTFSYATGSELKISGDSLGYAGGAYTLSLWVKSAALPTSWGGIIRIEDDTTSHTCLRFVYFKQSGVVKFFWMRDRFNIASDYVYPVGFTLPVGSWAHICGVYDTTNLIFYYNGTLSISGPATGSGTALAGSFFKIGRTDTPDWKFGGQIDEVICEDNAWSYEKVKKYYNYMTKRGGPRVRQ
jgi:hypothetical protein